MTQAACTSAAGGHHSLRISQEGQRTEAARVRPPWTVPLPKRAWRALLAASSSSTAGPLCSLSSELLEGLRLRKRLRCARSALPGLPGARPRLLLQSGLWSQQSVSAQQERSQAWQTSS